jgi:hypothetical protein
VAAGPVEEVRDLSQLRQAIVAANPELQERELIKLARLAEALTDALRRRGVADPAASLAAEAGIAVFKIAFRRWVGATGDETLTQLIQQSLAEMQKVATGN